MDNLTNNADLVTMHTIAKYVNNENLDEEIIVFDHDVRIANEKMFPIRIDGMLIALCTGGNGKIGIDLNQYNLKRNSLIVIQPKNYIHLSEFSPEFEGSIVVCSRHLVEDVLPKLTDIVPLLIHHRTEPVTQLTESEATGIRNFYKFLREKLRGPKTRFLQQKINSILQATLYEMMDIIDLRSSKIPESSRTRKEEIMARFILAVSEEFRTQRQVAYYAQKLCISPKHLSSVVKEISGRTAGDWIENYVVMESKVLLKTTDMTIQEIAVYLNFANQSFFGKYFKQHTGCSPTSYRKQNN